MALAIDEEMVSSFMYRSQEEKRVILRATRYRASGITLPLPRAKLESVRKNPLEYFSFYTWGQS